MRAGTVFLVLTLAVSARPAPAGEPGDDPVARLKAIISGPNPDEYTAVRVAVAAADPRGREAVPFLIKALEHRNTRVRSGALYALKLLGPQAAEAVPALRKLLDYKGTAPGAAYALGAIGPAARAAVPKLIKLLEDPSCRFSAAYNLGLIGAGAKEAVPRLTEMLKDKSYRARQMAVMALGLIGPEAASAVGALEEVIAGDTRNDRAAVRALCRIGEKGVPALVKVLTSHKSSALRAEAAKRLAEMGPRARAAVPALKKLASVRDPRHWAVEALGAVGAEDPEVISFLSRTMLSAPNYTLRGIAAEALGGTKIEKAERRRLAGSLLGGLRNTGPGVRELAVLCLGCVADPGDPRALSALAGALRRDAITSVRRTAATALGRLAPGDAGAIAALEAALGDAKEEVRREAALALAKIGRPAAAALPALRTLLKGEKLMVRAAAAEAVWRVSGQADEPARMLGRAMAAGEEPHGYAADALRRMGPAARAAVPDLIKALERNKGNIWYRAAETLGRIGPEASAALPALRKLSKNPQIGSTAKKAIERITTPAAGDPEPGAEFDPRDF